MTNLTHLVEDLVLCAAAAHQDRYYQHNHGAFGHDAEPPHSVQLAETVLNDYGYWMLLEHENALDDMYEESEHW